MVSSHLMPPRKKSYRAIYCRKIAHEGKACQFLKRNNKQHKMLPAKGAESKPWGVLCVNLIEQYRFKPKGVCKKNQNFSPFKSSI